MKRIRVNIEKISEFDLKVARNLRAIEVVEEIIKLSPDERTTWLQEIQQKVQEGDADLFEEKVLVKLLEPQKAEWIRVIHKNLPGIEQEFAKRQQPQTPTSPPLQSQTSSPPKQARRPNQEYPSELLEFLATQKPPTSPAKSSAQTIQPTATVPEKRPAWTTREIVVGILLFAVLLVSLWYVRSSEESSPPIPTFDDQMREQAPEPDLPEEVQQQVEAAKQELLSGEFEEGKAQLLEIIESYPESSYAENAYMLIAETYRQRQNNPDEALRYYQLFTKTYPESSQFGLAQLKMGFAYEDMEDVVNAKEMYRLLIERHGEKSRLSQLANERLSRLQADQNP